MNKNNVVLVALLVSSFFVTQTYAQQGTKSSKANNEKSKQSNDLDEFIKRNPTVVAVSWKKGNQIVLMSKDGKEQTYDLNNTLVRKAFEDKYGKAPVAPPPPPPPPPAPSSPVPIAP